MEEFTAAMARKVSGVTQKAKVNEALKYAFETIKAAAEKKQTEVNLVNDFWCAEAYSSTSAYREAVLKLEQLGYTVSFFYEERQFVNMFTVVKWFEGE